jgi:hypothetical protein
MDGTLVNDLFGASEAQEGQTPHRKTKMPALGQKE